MDYKKAKTISEKTIRLVNCILIGLGRHRLLTLAGTVALGGLIGGLFYSADAQAGHNTDSNTFHLNHHNVSRLETRLIRKPTPPRWKGSKKINRQWRIDRTTLVLDGAGGRDRWGLVSYGSGQGAGVWGVNDDLYSQLGYGVIGTCRQGGIGVFGEVLNRPGIGVWGISTEPHPGSGIGAIDGIGVLGRGYGVGVLGMANRTGVWGTGELHGVSGFSASGAGVLGESRDGDAGRFHGNVTITGDLNVQGAKSAVVPFPDGSSRRVYSQESPESWFEDFGEANLENGVATVRLDQGFSDVTTGDFHVFLTPHADCNGLYISKRGNNQFEVRELGGGRGTLKFSYRVVARRKDIEAPRFGKIVMPDRPEPIRIPQPKVQRSEDLLKPEQEERPEEEGLLEVE